MQYLFQSFNFRGEATPSLDLIKDVGIEEISHVIEGTEFPLPNDDLVLENNWAIHQLHTTTNFGNNSRWFSWFVGGLNFQIEHHLFPSICHVHYRKISGIVQQTASEFNIPYKNASSFLRALKGHARLLRQLGRRPIENILTPQPM